MKPGRTVFPVTSIVFVPAGIGTDPLRPTAWMRLPWTTTTPSSITSSPFIVTTRPPVNARVEVGSSIGAAKPMSTPRIGGSGSFSGEPGRNANASFRSRSKSRGPTAQ
jgi:hypothetical protein